MIAAKEASYKITPIPDSWDGFYDQSVVAIHDPHTKKIASSQIVAFIFLMNRK